MKLKNFIDNSIYEYPTLYRSFDYKKSRLLVLNHIFLSYGTALEWSPEGFLSYLGEKEGEYRIFQPIELPNNFFEINLWYIDLVEKDLPVVKDILKDHFYYIRSGSLYEKLTLVYEADEELATELERNFSAKDPRVAENFKHITGRDYPVKPFSASSFERSHSDLSKTSLLRRLIKTNPQDYIETEYEPTQICQYSPVVEMINKRTNSPHIKNFDLTFIMPDWIEGAIEVSKWALGFYKDPNRNIFSRSHPSNCLKDFKKYYNDDPVKYRKSWKSEGMTEEHTIEQWCEIRWQKLLAENVNYFETLIKMYS
jgi:hypothetical protein